MANALIALAKVQWTQKVQCELITDNVMTLWCDGGGKRTDVEHRDM